MASVFLSYAREDAAKAKALAKCLERAGHSVWWDRHIHGGSEYAGEIEAALREAEVVVVLWSETSIHSAWVRDEAAEGRDSGRLVPLLLDDSAPPLGFRQLQTIPVAGWSGRGNPPHAQEIVAAVAARSGREHKPAAAAAPRTLPRRAVLAGIAVLAALLTAFGAWWLLGSRGEASTTPVLAVLPFSDLSPEGDKAYLAEGVAEAILSGLAKEPGIKVIGRSSAKQLQDAGGAAPEMRRAMGITHVLEGSARSIGDQLRMSVRLIDASDGQQIWAEEYSRRLDNIFAVQDEIGRAVAQRLRGSFAATRPGGQAPTSADAYTLYLAARAKMRDRRMSSLQDALKLAQQVIAADPNYAPGHALYAELIAHLSYDNYGKLSQERVRQLAMPHVRKAIQLAPQAAEGYAALAMVSPGETAIKPLETAIRLDPARAELRLWLAHAYNRAGRNADALRETRAATELEPLWWTLISMEASILAASDRFDEAESVIAQFERRGGSRARAAKMRGDSAAYYRGDFSKGIRLAHEAVKADPETPLANQSFAWFYRAVGLNDQAARAAQDLPLYTRLYVSGEHQRLLERIRRDGAEIWRQPDPDIAIDALALERDWAAIEKLYDANRESLRLVCTDNRNWNVALGVNLAAALNAHGRAAEGKRFIDCVKSNLTKNGEGPIRSPYMSNGALDALWAQVHALEGDPAQAFARMDRAIDRGTRTSFGRGLSQIPMFDAFRSDPAYARLDSRLKQLIARERAEVLADRRRAT